MILAFAARFFIKLVSPMRRAWFVNFVSKMIFAFAARVLKAFGVAEALSLLAKKVPKETSPGIARKPAKKFVRQGAVITRLALPSRASDICRLKTLANDFLTARFTGPKEQPRRAKTTYLKLPRI